MWLQCTLPPRSPSLRLYCTYIRNLNPVYNTLICMVLLRRVGACLRVVVRIKCYHLKNRLASSSDSKQVLKSNRLLNSRVRYKYSSSHQSHMYTTAAKSCPYYSLGYPLYPPLDITPHEPLWSRLIFLQSHNAPFKHSISLHELLPRQLLPHHHFPIPRHIFPNGRHVLV